MDLIKLLTDLSSAIDALKQQLADASVAAQENYSAGFAAGVASVPPSGDKLYSQAELDAALAGAVGPLNEKIAALQVQVDGLPALIDSAVSKAKDDLKASIAALVSAEDADLQSKISAL